MSNNFKRINENMARKLWLRGFDILITSTAEKPDYVAFSPYVWHNKYEGISFNMLSENLRIKLGDYRYKVHYYIDNNKDIVIRLYDTHDNLVETYRGSTLDCYYELKHWAMDYHISTSKQGIYELRAKCNNIPSPSLTDNVYFN